MKINAAQAQGDQVSLEKNRPKSSPTHVLSILCNMYTPFTMENVDLYLAYLPIYFFKINYPE
jgi:hypothetical protein